MQTSGVSTREELKEFIDRLGSVPSPEEFQTVLEKAVELGITVRRIADALGTGQANVARWLRKDNLPYPSVRLMLVRALRDIL